eukprot:403353804
MNQQSIVEQNLNQIKNSTLEVIEKSDINTKHLFHLLNEMIKVKLGIEDQPPQSSDMIISSTTQNPAQIQQQQQYNNQNYKQHIEVIATKDQILEKDLGSCLQILKKYKHDLLTDLNLFSEQLVQVNMDNMERFDNHVKAATNLDVSEKDEICDSISEIDNFL